MKIDPTLTHEKALRKQGFLVVAGIDEAGRGALAGPVVAAAVVLPDREDLEQHLSGVRDSKMMTAVSREKSYALILEVARSYGIGTVDNEEIDAIGILPATRKAMCLALDVLDPAPDFLLLDYVRIDSRNIPQLSITKGDRISLSIAAASILAKVTRDQWMCEVAEKQYPGYGFSQHKGYGTQKHLEAIEKLSPCKIHRRSFGPIRKEMTLF